ncbi:MAG: hypothetical protein U0234_14985 [Sandaracinus sp.]
MLVSAVVSLGGACGAAPPTVAGSAVPTSAAPQSAPATVAATTSPSTCERTAPPSLAPVAAPMDHDVQTEERVRARLADWDRPAPTVSPPPYGTAAVTWLTTSVALVWALTDSVRWGTSSGIDEPLPVRAALIGPTADEDEGLESFFASHDVVNECAGLDVLLQTPRFTRAPQAHATPNAYRAFAHDALEDAIDHLGLSSAASEALSLVRRLRRELTPSGASRAIEP